MTKENAQHTLIQAIKIALGSCIAIYAATWLNLNFATSSGIITLLSILTTKWETVKISIFRVITFIITVILSTVVFHIVSSAWIAFGIFILLLVLICEWIGWKATISVNAVIGTHFLTTHDFSFTSILNEFLLVVIGITIAVFLNLFHNNSSVHNRIIQNMRYTEEQLQMIMEELVKYMELQEMNLSVWGHIVALEKDLGTFVELAYKYQNNTFRSHPSYYIHYFEMRTQQCNILHNLHYQMKKLRYMPKQAQLIAGYISYMKDFVVELNVPTEQIQRLEEISEDMKNEPLPESRDEFESRAILYHILMDLEEFLIFKKRFVESLSEEQVSIYWEMKDK